MPDHDTAYIHPALGRKVLDPATGAYLPEAGAEVELTSYWRRRLRDGDVRRGKPRKLTLFTGGKKA